MDMQQRKQMIRDTFDTVAEDYDHPSLRFFQETAQRMLDYLAPDPAARCLDVATGTGMVALEAAQRLPAGSIIGPPLSLALRLRSDKTATSCWPLCKTLVTRQEKRRALCWACWLMSG